MIEYTGILEPSTIFSGFVRIANMAIFCVRIANIVVFNTTTLEYLDVFVRIEYRPDKPSNIHQNHY